MTSLGQSVTKQKNDQLAAANHYPREREKKHKYSDHFVDIKPELRVLECKKT